MIAAVYLAMTIAVAALVARRSLAMFWFFVVLGASVAGLKLSGSIVLSWWWVTLPLWGAMGGIFIKMWLGTFDPFWRAR